jgi:hypothetical protein
MQHHPSRPLALVPRGPTSIDVIGVTEDGELTMRSLDLLTNGTVGLR